ncbi:sigma-70 family RNA polymerase sigma factor [Bremerella sp. T1]|uniref:sigma-70 family RNA polymerase sigma factor n=1 Tax=Bremerella sp. TYQ1 TaxID=3119568 RepID=UPI001CCE45B1|nr:sigma-70 family RNA polymerase sigma factor [Bremerella volcania]UBM36702.1 sigma-70 family RNA polymerase sigma factor [Bremerella volcania]
MTTNTSKSHEEFMRRFLECQRELLRYVMCFVPNSHDARDIVQNTAVALWKKYDEFDPSEPFLPWACRFSLLEVKLYMRREKKWKHFLDDETIASLAIRRDELSDDLDERRIHLRDCLRHLSGKQRSIVEGYYFNDLTVEQLSKKSGRSVDAIYKALQRVRSVLMDCVTRKQAADMGAGQ